MTATFEERSQRCLKAIRMLQEAFGGENHPLVMEPIFEDNQLAYIRFILCLPEEWQGDPDECMSQFDWAWSVPHGHTLPGIVFDYTKA